MRQTVKVSALGFSAACFCLAADAAMGLGTAQWLADLCLTDASDDMSTMAMEPVTPAPFLLFSTAFAGIGMGLLFTEDREAALGLTPPDPSDRTAILSAIILTAAACGGTRQQDISDVFEIVTGSALEPELARFAYQRYRALDPAALRTYQIAPSDNPLGRRRVVAAALLTGCIAHAPSRQATRMIERLTVNIGATPADISAAKSALQTWTNSDCQLKGAPLITFLKGKPLGLRPA